MSSLPDRRVWRDAGPRATRPGVQAPAGFVDTSAMRDRAESNWADDEVRKFLDQIAGGGGQDYRRMVERLPVIVYASELGEHGRWRYVSPQVEEILGYSAEQFLSDPGLWARLLHPDDRERALGVEDEALLG